MQLTHQGPGLRAQGPDRVNKLKTSPRLLSALVFAALTQGLWSSAALAADTTAMVSRAARTSS